MAGEWDLLVAGVLSEHAFLVRCWTAPIILNFSPIYSIVYTKVGIHSDGFLARGTAPDKDIPKDVAGAMWYEVLGILVEHS